MRPWEFVCNMSIVQLVNVYFLLLFAFTFTFPTFLDRCLLGTCCFCPAPYHFEHLPTTHSADSGYATSPILRSHPFFIFHISPNLTFHTVSFCCQCLRAHLQMSLKIMIEYPASIPLNVLSHTHSCLLRHPQEWQFFLIMWFN